MHRWVAALLCAALVSLTIAAGAAPGLVIVTSTNDDAPRAGLIEALRIQLAGRAEIRPGATLGSSAVTSSTEAATALEVAEHAKLVVWVERDPGDARVYLLHIVGDHEGRQLVLVHRLGADEESGLDRTLALKVAEVFDAVTIAPPEVAIARKIDRKSDAPPPTTTAPREPSRFAFVGDIGGWGATGSGTAPPQGGVSFGAGVRMRLGAFVAELAGRGRVVTELETETEAGRVTATEGDFSARLGLGGVMGFLGLGAALEVGGRVLNATGETVDGHTGDGSTIVPFLAVVPQATFFLTSFLALRADVGLEVSLRHHRFLVDDVPVLDLGTFRGVVGGSFLFSTP